MNEDSGDARTGMTTRIDLPCRVGDRPVPVVWTIRPSEHTERGPSTFYLLELEVTVHYPVGGHGTHTFTLHTIRPMVESLADGLQRLYDTREVTTDVGLPNEHNLETDIGFRAHDLEAEEISFSCILRSNGYRGALPEGPLDQRLSKCGWYQEEKKVLRDHFWIIGVHGLLLKRDDLPAIIAKLKGIPWPVT